MAARPCTYTFTDQHGAVKTLGLDEFKAYLASGGLKELLPGGVPGAAQFSRPSAETPQFEQAPEERSSLWKRWFGKSKMVSKGQPIKFYHGSPEEVTVFNKDKLGGNTKHPSAGLGFFFTRDKGEATNYGGKVMEVFLSSQNPYVTNSWDIDRNFDSVEGAKKFAKQLQSKGYDSIYLKDAGYAVMFDSNQAKLTSNKSPTFGEDVRFSRPAEPDFLGPLKELAKDDEIFRHPVSDAKTLNGVMEDVAPQFKHVPEEDSTFPGEDGEQVTSRMFRLPNGREITIYENPTHVWLDVSNLTPGDKGGAIYAVAGNYAFNSGKKFIDDPKGVSEHAVLRRPMHMLSLALRFGTTDFLDVSPNFEESSQMYGLTPLNWRQSSDADRLSLLIIRNVFPIYHAIPELNNVRYDFKSGDFKSAIDGGDLQPTWAEILAGEGVSTEYGVRIGEAAIRRAVFLKSLASTTSEEKSELLERIGDDGRLAGGVSLKGVFSRGEARPISAPISEAQATEHLKANFGVGIDNLINTGVLNFTRTKEGWPKSAQDAARGDEEAVYVNGKVYIDLSHTPQSRLNAVMLHEIGEHYGLRRMLGDHAYASLQQQIENRAKIAGSQAARVWQEVKDNYEHLQEGSEPFIAEVIAKLGEENPKAPWYRRILAHIKSFLMKMGLARGIVAGTITEADLHELLITSLRKSASDIGKENVRLYGGAEQLQALYSAKAQRFYSALRRAVRMAPDQAFSNPAQLKAWINGNAPKHDVKKDEIYWSGIEDWLDAQQGKNSRDDVLKFLDENGVKVEDVVLGNAPEISDVLIKKATKDLKGTDYSPYYDAPRGQLLFNRKAGMFSELVAFSDLPDDLQQKLGYLSGGEPAKHNTGQLTLPGGTDYRELVLTVPNIEKFNEHDTIHFGDTGQGRQIAWTRYNTRIDADGNSGLFLEEVQSQRSQSGRKSGFNQKISHAELVRFNELENIFWKDMTEDEKIEYDKLLVKKEGGVPAAPFVTDAKNKATNAYITLLMKKAVSQAIDNGQNFVAWTTGDQQADRYDLSKQVDSIEAGKNADDTYDVRVYYANNSGEKDFDGQTKSELIELLGKELADRIENQENKWHTYEGLDLKVGGEWAQTMYGDARGMDAKGKPSLILQAANDLARKFGGEIGTRTVTSVPYRESLLGKKADGEKMIREGRAWEAPALIITPEMREKILSSGMPMFSRTEQRTEEQKSTANTVSPQTQAVQKDLFDKLQSYYGSDKLAGQAVGWMGNKLHETMTALANGENMFLSVRQLADRMKYAMPKLQEYVEHMQNRGAEAGYWRRMADRLVKPWTKLEDIDLANRTIQNSTRQDIDASLEWTGVNFVENTDPKSDNFGEKYYAAYTQELLTKGRRQKLAVAAMQAGALPINQSAEAKADPDNYIRRGGFAFTTKEQAENFANVIAKAVREQRGERSRIAHERGVENTDQNLIRQYGEKTPGGMPGYEEIKKDYEKLSDKAKEIYSEQNKMLTQLFDARAQELINDIDMAVEDRKQAAMLIKSVRLQFETSALNFYYSPLSRYGDFWFYGTDSNGIPTYRTFKTEGERDRAKKEFISEGGKGVNGFPIAYGKNFDKLDDPGSPAAGDAFIAKIVTEVRNSNIDKDQQEILLDTIYQMYLDTLPDISVRHSGTHRKGTLGFDTDAAKNFANAMHHGATQIANLKHGRKMRKVLDQHDMALKYATSPQLAGVLEDKIKAEQWMMDNWDTYTSEYLHNLQKVPDLAAEHGWTDTMLQEAINLRNTFGDLDEDGAVEAIGRRLGDNEHIMELKKYMRQEDSTRLANALAEMYKSYNYTVAYKAGDMDNVATFLNKMNFMFSLGLGVSSGMVNTLQVPMVAMPIAAGKYGYANTTKEYSKAYGEFLTAVKRRLTDVDGNVSITEILREKLDAARKRNDLDAIADLEDEITAMNYFKDADDIARTRQFDLMGIAEEGYSYGGKFNQLSSIAGWMFHHGERFNREVTLLATYRLARQALRDGKMKGSLPLYSQTTLNEGGRVTQYTSPRAINHMQSIALARELNYEAHMDYGMENAARLFRGPFRKMAFQFKKYQQGMYWLWAKQLAESYGKKPVRTDFPEGEHGDKLYEAALQDREIARKTLKSILLAQVAFGGAMTLPALGAFQVVYETLAQAFGEPDEPEDMEKDIRMALYPLIGQAATEAFMTGLFNAFTPLNVSSRISLKDTFFHEPLTELEGREAATEYLSQVLGVTGGQFQKWWQAINLAAQGHGDRALEMSMPKAIGDVLKASRLGREGVTTLDQMPVREPSMFEVAAQAIGFSSAPTSRAYTERGYAKEHEKAIEETRTEIMRNEARAKLNGEVPDLTARLEWNRKHPELPIYPAHVEASRRGIAKSIKVREEHGYSVNPKLDYLYEENELYDAD